MNNKLNLSNLLSRTFAELQENPQLAGLYVAVMIPVTFVSQLFAAPDDAGMFGFDVGFRVTDAVLAQGLTAVVTVIGAFLVGVVVQYYLVAGLTRRTVSPGFDRFLPYIGISILSTMALAFGLLLLIIPGIILAVRWAPLMAMVIDRQDRTMDAFGDAWQATDGSGWSIFGASIVLVIGVLIISAVFGVVSLIAGELSIAAIAANAVVDTISSAIFAAFGVAAYRLVKDDSEELAATFE